MICRKDIEGQHIIDFDSVKERFALNVIDIDDVICELEPDPILTFTFKVGREVSF